MNPWHQNAQQFYAEMAPNQVNWADLAAQWMNQGTSMTPAMPAFPPHQQPLLQAHLPLQATGGFQVLQQTPPPPPPTRAIGLLPAPPPIGQSMMMNQQRQQWQPPPQLQPQQQQMPNMDMWRSPMSERMMPPNNFNNHTFMPQQQMVVQQRQQFRQQQPQRQQFPVGRTYNGGGFDGNRLPNMYPPRFDQPDSNQRPFGDGNGWFDEPTEWRTNAAELAAEYNDDDGERRRPMPLSEIRAEPPVDWNDLPTRATVHQSMAKPMFPSAAMSVDDSSSTPEIHDRPTYSNPEHPTSYSNPEHRPDDRGRSGEGQPRAHMTQPAPVPVPLMSIGIEQRKSLPAWIREGLELADREKAKTAEEEAEMESGLRRPLTPTPSASREGRGRFDSSDSEEELPAGDAGDRRSTSPMSDSGLMRPSPPPSPGEFRQISVSRTTILSQPQNMLQAGLFREWMTSLLLNTCDELVASIVGGVHEVEMRQAQPRVLTSSSALAAIVGHDVNAIQSTRTSLVAFDSDDESDDEDGKVGRPPPSSSAMPPPAKLFKMPAIPPPPSNRKSAMKVDNPRMEGKNDKSSNNDSKSSLPRKERPRDSNSDRKRSHATKSERKRSRSPKSSRDTRRRSRSPRRAEDKSRSSRRERSRSPKRSSSSRRK